MLSTLAPPPGTGRWDDIRAWRRQAREALIGHRLAIPLRDRRAEGERMKDCIRRAMALPTCETIGIYWPIRGEIDVRDLALEHIEAGGRVALPVVVAKGAPVEFWLWRPGAPMQRGFWNIPVPAEREAVEPDALIVPLVGFDERGFRLGYGGGYYDRTLAAARRRPFCIGVGYVWAGLDSICPQPHDIPMDVVVTEGGLVDRRDLA
jgi:5-formyltetrahydrofolate cyclo-ligase